MKVQLTDRFCQHAKSDEPQTDYFDEVVRGLALRVTNQGTKSWTLHYGTPRKRVTLGRYPAMSLAAARTAAMETKEGRAHGTIAALAEVYLKSIKGNRSVGEVERRLRKDILPIIGHIALRDLHRRDVTRVLDAKSAPIAARRVFEDIRGMVRWAVSRGDLDHNPIDGMKGPPASKARERVLSDDEIQALWQAKLPPQAEQILKLCLLTAQRLGEVTGLQRSELDLTRGIWSIPGSRTKNGHAHSVPLSPLALSIIEEALAHAADGVIFKRRWAEHIGEAIKAARMDGPHWTAHDLRRTALTKMAELGIPPIVLGHIANHRTTTKAGMTLGVYVHHQYEREKREALELWADRVQGIVSGGAKVLPIRLDEIVDVKVCT
jgi:integrase